LSALERTVGIGDHDNKDNGKRVLVQGSPGPTARRRFWDERSILAVSRQRN
jgi:hypothetical protein